MKKPLLTIIGDTVRRLVFVLPAILIAGCPSAQASQGDFSSTDAFLKATLESGDELSLEARGDLNGDGLEDWAGVIHRQKANPPPTAQLYVLLRLRQGGYRVVEKSKEASVAGMGCCWVENLEISRSSVYIQSNAKTAVSMEAATHQFKLYQGEWRLIGVRVYLIDFHTDVSTETDMNLLTGSVIEKRQKGENKPTTRRRRKQFATYLLKDFDFYNGFGTE
jgi:hypothetical protein